MTTPSAPSTPLLRLDRAQLERNLVAMQDRCDTAGVRLRPHAKGHRSPWIAARQMRLGAIGIAVATAPEADSMLRAGIPDVLITSALAPPAAAIAAAVSGLGKVTVVADSVEAVRLLLIAAARSGVVLPVLVDIDVGQHRGGVRDGNGAVRVAAAIAEADGLELAGVQAYEGHLQGIAEAAERRRRHRDAMAVVNSIVGQMSDAGFAVPWVSSAGTGTTDFALATEVITEVQPGSYALMDHTYLRTADSVFKPAVGIIASVIAVIADDEVIIDAGNRAVSTDLGPPVVADRDATWELAGDEHGRLRGSVSDLRIGDLVELVPSHADTTVPLYRSFATSGATLPINQPR